MENQKIIVRLKGGLGNQIFQFATGYGIAKETGLNLLLDISYFDTDARHGGCMIQHILPIKPESLIKINGALDSTIFINAENTPSEFLPYIYKISTTTVISGYFQNWKYIDKVLGDLRKLYTTKTQTHLNGAYFDLLNKLSFNNKKLKVGVHIRRGDYTDKNVADIHGLINFNKITETALELVQEKAQELEIEKWIFTDDPFCIPPEGWLIFPAIKNKLASSILTFIAMSECDYLVCSNSTFSYTAGVLGKCQTIKLPSQWMKNNKIKTKDLFGERMQIYQSEFD